MKVLVREEGTVDNNDDRRMPESPRFISEGKKPSGEEVSISLVYALGLWTGQTSFLVMLNLRLLLVLVQSVTKVMK